MIHFDGPCLFLTCFEADPHDHSVCPECDACSFGNMFCAWCNVRRPAYEEIVLAPACPTRRLPTYQRRDEPRQQNG